MRKLFAKVLLQLTLLSVASLTLWRCAPSIYYVKPTDWEKPQRQDSTIAYYSQYIKGWKIFVDPGHGGADRFGHGPTGETEADINLRVGLALRDYLTRAGAIVFMSRTKDTTVSLLDRPKMAAEDGADIFISIHHNATGGPERYPPLNYTSTWYHAVKGDSAYTPADHDLARYVERDLAYAMGNPEPNFFSFDGTLSDYLVYPLAGFAVLRHSKIPAILTECSFFSSPYEEQRLKHDTFNEIEAWGIFKGLGKYLKAGIPRLTYSGDTLFNKIPVSFNIGYSEGEFFGGKYAIDKKYLKAEIDGKPVNAVFDSDSDRISLTSTTLLPGRHYLSVVIKNEEGNHSFPFLRHFYYVPPPAEISALVNPDTLSVKPTRFFTRVVVRSADNYNISDFVNPAAAVTNATADTTFHSDGAIYTIFSKSDSSTPVIRFTLDTLDTIISPAVGKYISVGTISVRSLSGDPIGGAVICTGSKVIATSLANGFASFKYDGVPLSVSLPGYYIQTCNTIPEAPIKLTPIADSLLIGKTILIDPAFGGEDSGPSSGSLTAASIDLSVARDLNDLLRSFGANSHLVRSTDTTLTIEQRADLSRGYSRGFYISISAVNPVPKFSVTIYPSIANRRLASTLQASLSVEFDTTGTAISRNGIFELAALSTVGVELPSPITTFYSEEELDRQSTEIAWRILDGMLGYYGYFKSFSKSDYTRLDEVLNLPMSGGKVFSVNPYQLRLINTHLLQEYKKGNEDK
ncbi:MAG: N-acetylmuramoyl-L-alanine amidase [Bacteroidetes bacterium]|nr:N-acetylmuramoyl-L-alanine amidase [Bacteroidota bacterium]MCL5034163.1 N-acetylmuramoyl-L-alanine amidase [Bacteroidota bacterium]